VQRARLPIALVLTSFDPGGTERQMTELIGRLDPSRFAVHVACFRRDGLWRSKVEAAAIEVAEFPLRGFASASAARELMRFARWCRRRRLTVVHACDFYANVFALPAAALARVPVRIGSRRDLVLPGRTAAQYRLQRLAYRAAHVVVANSRAAAAQVQHDGVARTRIAIIPNGIDLTRYAAPRGGRPTRVVTTIANLRPEKGHDGWLAAAPEVLRRHPDVVFHIVGDGPCRAALEHEAAALGIASSIRFLGHREDVPEVLRDSDVFVLPSRSEAFPNGVVEGMAAGLPVVASDVGGIPELIENGRTGVLVPVGDTAALANTLIRLLDDPGYATALGTGGREVIARGYSFERMVASFEALYLERAGLRLSSSLPFPSPARG
jgi:glycosyltransferase involved in cell wall biosynthesis